MNLLGVVEGVDDDPEGRGGEDLICMDEKVLMICDLFLPG